MSLFSRWLRVFSFSIAALCGLILPAFGGEALQIRGQTDGNWWTLGEHVVFQAKDSSALQGAVSLTGTVRDSEGKTVAEVTVPTADFTATGWTWKPEQPGFYTVSFSSVDSAGTRTALTETYTTKSSGLNTEGKSTSVQSFDIVRAEHDFVVTRDKTRAPADIPPLFGICMDMRTNHPPVLAAKVGFHFIRLHPTAWWIFEPAEGQYDWSLMDAFMKDAEDHGFRDFVGNPFGTPKWASTASADLKGAMVYKDRYSAYMPASVDSWTKFLDALVKRYPMIKTWELWNEENLPGQSIFWMSSPEDFASLLKVGYKQVKESAPGSEVWIGGMGMGYVPFYDQILKLGSGADFDDLALHGLNVTPAPFNAVDERYKVPIKPWVNSEWHGILMKSGDSSYPEERALASQMVLDLLQQIRGGVKRVALFALINHDQGREREVMAQLKKIGDIRTSVSGLFRHTPYAEPRFPACILRNVIDCFSGEIRLTKTYTLAEHVYAAALESDADPVVIFWSDQEAPLPASLAAARGPDSLLTDWEGKTVETPELRPGIMYFLRKPNADAVKAWPVGDSDIFEKDTQALLSEVDWAPLGDGAWIDVPSYTALQGKEKDAGFSARFLPNFTGAGLDLTVEVKDASHAQTATDVTIWKGDSIQFAIDARGKGYGKDRLEFSAALTPKGPLLWKNAAPSLVGDIPSKYTNPGQAVGFGKATITPIPGGLSYQIHIDREDLYPFLPGEGKPVRFSLTVNNSDATEREGYLHWGDGIVAKKDPQLYGTLIPTTNLMASTTDLKGTTPGENGAVSITVGDGADRANLTPLNVTGGEHLILALEWRGAITPQIIATATGGAESQRIDVMKKTKLDAEKWTTLRRPITVPPGANKLQIAFVGWKQTGAFEVRNLHVYRAVSDPAPQ